MDYEVPFGPFLVIGALIVWFANLFAMALPHLLFPL
jgi:prepilin signal peptidase PulO-like enzyme (type II secretory pathway)